MKNIIILLLLSSTIIQAQNKKHKDRDAIKEMCGCYEVTFKFAETFNYSKDSLYMPSPDKIAYALEWIDLTYHDQNNLVIQHILQMGSDSNAYIMKHWRQDWHFQERKMLNFLNKNHWETINKSYNDVKGQWTQKVFQVDDSPRYEGSGSWVHIDGKSYWENTTDAPLPRRERTIRDDYNVLNRGNRVELTKSGWIHKQDNIKIFRDTTDIIIAKEVGYNTYKKVDDSKCIYAKKWWKKNLKKWEIVREEWDNLFNTKSEIKLHSKVDDKFLWQYLFSDQYSTRKDIKELINKFIK